MNNGPRLKSFALLLSFSFLRDFGLNFDFVGRGFCKRGSHRNRVVCIHNCSLVSLFSDLYSVSGRRKC